MIDLPPGWETTRLDNVAEVRLGRQRSPKNHTGAHMRPYLRAANIGWKGLNLDDVKTMNFTDSEAVTYRLHPGDLIISEASGTAGEVGKPALWQGEIEDCCFQNTLLRVRSYGPDPKYLLYFLRSEALRGAFGAKAPGVGIHHLGAARLSSWEIPVPPLKEQQRVAAALDDYMSYLDKAESTGDSAAIRLEALRKRIIIDAVPDQVPAHWVATNVGDAGHVELGRSRSPKWHTGPNMRPYLRVANVYEDRIDDSDLKEMHFPHEVFERYRLAEGDVLLNEGQSPEFLGRPALYRGIPKEIAFTNTLLRFRGRPDVLPEWALLVFRRHMHAGRFLREVRITTNIAHLSASRLKPVEFPLPPLEEQERIVADVREKLKRVDRLKAGIEVARNRIGGLRRSLLNEAFSGRLVPQGLSDEPASKLLARVSAERANRGRRKRQPIPIETATPAPTNSVQERLL